MTTRGLTLGKFAPLHLGHQRVIEIGLSETDRMCVIVYDSPAVTRVPLAVRSGWIRRLYPQVRVVEAWDGPQCSGYSEAVMRAHERYIIETLGVNDISHFYSSEPYGEHMSEALGAVDRRVDQVRRRHPISGTQLRQQPYRYRQYLDDVVYRDLITNVVFMGAPSTGKSTLAAALAKQFDTQWMPEYGREYWQRHQVQRRLTPSQLVDIARGHVSREDELLLSANRYLFTDTNAITTATFARYYHGSVEAELSRLAEQAISRYDLVFVCDVDIPYEESSDRSGEANRAYFQRQVLADLNQRKVPYIVLTGNLERRIATVCALLARHEKYMNPLELFAAASDA